MRVIIPGPAYAQGMPILDRVLRLCWRAFFKTAPTASRLWPVVCGLPEDVAPAIDDKRPYASFFSAKRSNVPRRLARVFSSRFGFSGVRNPRDNSAIYNETSSEKSMRDWVIFRSSRWKYTGWSEKIGVTLMYNVLRIYESYLKTLQKI